MHYAHQQGHNTGHSGGMYRNLPPMVHDQFHDTGHSSSRKEHREPHRRALHGDEQSRTAETDDGYNVWPQSFVPIVKTHIPDRTHLLQCEYQ